MFAVLIGLFDEIVSAIPVASNVVEAVAFCVIERGKLKVSRRLMPPGQFVTLNYQRLVAETHCWFHWNERKAV